MPSEGEIQRPPRGPPPILPKPRRGYPSSAPSVQLSRPSAVAYQSRGPPPIPPKSRHAFPSSAPSVQLSRPSTVASKYLMNDIERNTPRMKIINSLLSPRHRPNDDHTAPSDPQRPDVIFACTITNSRLDDELSVATIELTDTPQWLQYLNDDPFGFPKKTAFGTLWKAIDRNAIDEHGRTEYIRAVMAGSMNLTYAEMLAEFSDTDINIQDKDGRTALHWASANNFSDIVRLCLSVPECDIGLKDNDGLTAFDISLRSGNQHIATSFYKSMFEIQDTHPQEALLRVLTVSSTPDTDRPDYPGIAIFDPVIDSNTRLVKALIKRGVDLKATNEDGDTALHIAAAMIDNSEIAEMLLDGGADVNAIGRDGASPLHHAVQTSDRRMVQTILEWEPTPDAKDKGGKTALERAEENHNQDMVALLNGADACESGVELAEELEMQKERENPTQENAVEQKIEEKDVIKLVAPYAIARGKSGDLDIFNWRRNNRRQKTLLKATINGEWGKVRSLLQLGTDIETKGAGKQTALHLACRHGHIEIVKLLLDAGAQIGAVEVQKWTALHMASEHGYTAIVQLLLDAGSQINAIEEDDWTPLQMASASGHTAVVKLLLDAGAQINAVDNVNRTALHMASEHGNTAIVKLLLDAGAQINEVEKDLWTALHKAARHGHTEIVKLLLDGGVQINAMQKENWTALQLAARNGYTEIAKLLLDAGAQINSVDHYNQTALHKGARHGYTEIVILLLNAGAEIETDSPEGTALRLASRHGHQEIVKALVEAGASTTMADRPQDSVLRRLGLYDKSQ